jgi:hypothetical protein
VVASYDFSGAFNITGVNGYVPFVSFDPSADGVPYAPVLHYTDAISIKQCLGGKAGRLPE